MDVAAAPQEAAVGDAQAVKVLKVALPDGRIGLVRYRGEVPPLRLAQDRRVLVLVPVRPVADPFAAFDAMFADMDRQMDAMLRQAASLAARAPAAGAANGVTLAGS